MLISLNAGRRGVFRPQGRCSKALGSALVKIGVKIGAKKKPTAAKTLWARELLPDFESLAIDRGHNAIAAWQGPDLTSSNQEPALTVMAAHPCSARKMIDAEGRILPLDFQYITRDRLQMQA